MLGTFLALLETEEEKRRFEVLYNEYGSTVYNYAYHILKDVQLSEDAVSEAFFSLARHMDKIQDRSDKDARNYLIVIAKNRAKKMAENQSRTAPVEEVWPDSADPEDVELETDSRDIRDRLLEAIRSMDEKYADVVIMKYYYQFKEAEIAHELGVTLETVKIRLHRARKQLREMLEKEAFYSE